MESKAIQKNLGHSPRKLRLVADMVRSMSVDQALTTLKFANKAAAITLEKAIRTALANSGNGTGATMFFKSLEVNEGMKMRRFRATGGKGRARPYKRRMSQIRVVLTNVTPDTKVKAQKAKVSKAPASAVKKEEPVVVAK